MCMEEAGIFLDHNMGAECDVILHKRDGKLEKIRDVVMASTHFPLLFPHGDLRCH